MSSHHIVREKQEPALYIEKLLGFDIELLGQILEWSPTIFVAESQYEIVNSLGIKIDGVFLQEEGLYLQENTNGILIPNFRLIDVVQYLIDQDYPALNVIGESFAFDGLGSLLQQINVTLFTPNQKSYPIKSGFKFWKTQGTILEIKAMEYFESKNLMSLNGSRFQVIEDGFVEFNFSGDYLYLAEYLD